MIDVGSADDSRLVRAVHRRSWFSVSGILIAVIAVPAATCTDNLNEEMAFEAEVAVAEAPAAVLAPVYQMENLSPPRPVTASEDVPGQLATGTVRDSEGETLSDSGLCLVLCWGRAVVPIDRVELGRCATQAQRSIEDFRCSVP